MWGWTIKHDSLRLRLLVAIVGGVAVISAAAMILDYCREYRRGLDHILVSLDEQAGALLEAHRVIQAVAPTNGDCQRDDMTILGFQCVPAEDGMHG